MTGTTPKTLGVLLAVIGLVSTGCREQTHKGPARVRGAVAVDISFEHLSGSGQPKSGVDFPGAVVSELKARGLTVDDKSPVKISGRMSLADESNKDSTVGGPMAFFFVHGAYDLKVVDAAGKQRARASGPLDLRSMSNDALKSAQASFDQTAQNIVRAAAPRIADQLINALLAEKLVQTASE